MSLFGLSTAVAGIRAGKHSCDNAATDDAADTNECTVHLQLQQMAAVISACQRFAAQNRHQISAPDPVKAVQEGLQITQQQLQRLLQKQQPPGSTAQQQHNGQQAHSTTTTTSSSSSGGCAARVLQDLLQLAVGDVSLLAAAASDAPQHNTSSSSTASCTTSETASIRCKELESVAPTTTTATTAGPCWHPDTVHRSAKQQQLWEHAAAQAVQLFNLHDLLAGGSSTLHHALLLQPQLLDELLEALATAVLQPVLANLVPRTEPFSRNNKPVHSSSGSSSGGKGGASGGSCCSVATALANSKLPWTQLPDILAASPPLMIKASGTLLSWLEASGHLQLQQLSSLILRPAWKRMAAAAEPTPEAAAAAADRLHSFAQLTGGKPLSPRIAVHLNSAQLNSASCNSSTASHCLAAGAYQLVCPETWQQQLVQQLVQEPSVEGLAKLLQLLPGLSATDSCCGVHAGQQQGRPVGLAGCSGDGFVATEVQGWPAAEEWRSSCWQRDSRQYHLQQQQQQQCPASDTGANCNIRSRTPNPKACQQVQQGGDLLSVLAAWKLVVQHRCWYEFACYILVKGSITALQQQQQQQQSSHASVSLGSMQHASTFIAWVNEPVDTHMQHKRQQQLLAPVNNTDWSSVQTVEAEDDKASCTSSVHLCSHLLRGWQLALSGASVDKLAVHSRMAAAAADAAPVSTVAGDHVTAHAGGSTAGANSGATGAGGSTAGATASHCLVAVDLPVAILQQLQLLMQCTPHELLQLCFPAVVSNLPQQLQQHQLQMQPTASTRVHAASAVAHSQPAAAAFQESQSLEQSLEAAAMVRSVLCAALTAVDAVSGAAVEFFNAALKCNTQLVSFQGHTGAQQQQVQQLHCKMWLSRQWAAEVLTDMSFSNSFSEIADSHMLGKAAADTSAYFMQVAQKLLQSSTACDKLLKARAGVQ